MMKILSAKLLLQYYNLFLPIPVGSENANMYSAVPEWVVYVISAALLVVIAAMHHYSKSKRHD